QRAGGVRTGAAGNGWEFTPTLDGWFDRISIDLDPALGTKGEYARLVEAAAARKGSVAGDLVPLHTGLGPDFRLALRAYRDYPGMYTMIEVRRDDCGGADEPAVVVVREGKRAAAVGDRGEIPVGVVVVSVATNL